MVDFLRRSMNELLETKIRRKLSVLEDFARQTQPQGPDFFGQFKQGVLDALPSHKTSTLKKLDRELDTMAEEVFALPSAKPFREQYWSGEPSAIEEEVKRALRERRVRD